MDDALQMDTIDFELVNSSGDIIKNNDPARVKNFKYHMKSLGTHFRYPLFHNYLVLINLIFETSHWTEDLVFSLDEPERIKSMSKLSKEILMFGCSEVAESIGIKHTDAMFQSLAQMQFLTKTSLLSFASPPMTRISLESGEKLWTLIKTSFQEYCECIRPDHDLLKKVISVAAGDTTYRHEMIFCMTNIWIQRFQKVIDTIFQQSERAPIITANHFQLVLMAIVAQNDFSCQSLKDTVCVTIGLETYEKMEKHCSMPPNRSYLLFKNEMPDATYWIDVYTRAGRHLSNLMADKDLTLLFKLFLLFQQLPHQTNVLKTLETLLLKKLSEKKSLQCYQNGSNAINTFVEGINDFAKSNFNLFYMLSTSEPKMRGQEQKISE